MIPVQQALERIVSLSRADTVIALGWDTSSANVRWASNTATTNGVAESTQLSIISIIDGRVGSVSRSYFPQDRLESLVRESEAACEGKPAAEDAMPLIAGDGAPGDWDAPHEPTGIEVFAGLAPGLAELFKQAEASGIKLFGFAEHVTSTVRMLTSTGVARRFTGSEGTVQVNAKTPDYAKSVWAGQVTTTFRDVDLEALYRKVGRRLEWSATTISVPPGRYETLLEPSAVADMLIYAYWTSSARDADEGRSVFSRAGGGNRVGEKLYPEAITIYSDPREPGFRVAPFVVTEASSSYSSIFDNGRAIDRTEWVRDGVLRALITTRHWGTRSGLAPAPFIDNLIFDSPHGPTLNEMIASTERALLVTCLWYIREVDPQTLLLTGLTRDGVFLVEGGEVKGSVNNFRFNMSPVDLLAQTREIGRSEPTLAREFGDYFVFARMPSLRVENFNMSSVSESV